MTANAKPKFAMYWAASCGGCEIAVLNIHEKILDVDANFDVVFWPVAMDAKYKDVEAMEDGSILLTLFNGGIRNDENEHMAKLLRQKSKILVAFGSCASEGCIPGLANLSPVGEIVHTAFNTITTDNPNEIYPRTSYRCPEGEFHIPTLLPGLTTARPGGGCGLLHARLPARIASDRGGDRSGDQGAPRRSANCRRKARSSARAIRPSATNARGRAMSRSIKAFKRIQDIAPIDPTLCLLEQGIPCNGPATRSGCNARCPQAGAQCIGCYGPAEGVVDYGARLMTAFASSSMRTNRRRSTRSSTASPTRPGSSIASTWRVAAEGSQVRVGERVRR